MKVYVAALIDLENTHIVGVYSSEDVAVGKVEDAMDELYFDNEDLGVYPVIYERNLDDKDVEDYV